MQRQGDEARNGGSAGGNGREAVREHDRLLGILAEIEAVRGIVTLSPELEQLFESLVGEPARSAYLYGEAGTGRCRLVRRIGQRWGEPVQVVPAASLGLDELEDALARPAGTLALLDLDGATTCLQRRLAALLEGDRNAVLATGTWSTDEAGFVPELEALLASRQHRLPPLRERPYDAPLLAVRHLRALDPRARFEDGALSRLVDRRWPGNLAELRLCVEEAWERADGRAIRAADLREGDLLPWRPRPHPASILPFEEEERRILRRALVAADGNVTRAAQLLRIGRATFYRKIHQYRLRKPD